MGKRFRSTMIVHASQRTRSVAYDDDPTTFRKMKSCKVSKIKRSVVVEQFWIEKNLEHDEQETKKCDKINQFRAFGSDKIDVCGCDCRSCLLWKSRFQRGL